MLRPGSVEELAAIVRDSAARKRLLHTVGSGTKLHYGPPPPADAETVCLRGLDRITAHEPGDLVVSVQAGMRLADLQAALAAHRQWLPVDPPHAEATIGGILAANASGPRRLAYGTMRDLVLGMRVLGSDGTPAWSGSRVVKNVAGYGLHRLHIGAFGTLGVILEAALRLRFVPEVSSAAVFSCGSFEEALRLTLEVHASGMRPAALEAHDTRAIVGLEGSLASFDRHLRDLGRLERPFEIAAGRAVWDELREPPRGLVRLRVGARPHDLPAVMPPGAHRRAHAGTGVACVELEPAANLPERIAEWHRKAAAYGGYVVAESAPADCPGRERLPWGLPGDGLMRAIRASRDPDEILNRGRLVV